jgi:hypothetical protein
MNPVEIEADIRNLEVLLSGGSPVRPSADYGKGEVGHFEGFKARSPSVEPVIGTHGSTPSLDVIWESYVVSEDGKMEVKQPPAI